MFTFFPYKNNQMWQQAKIVIHFWKKPNPVRISPDWSHWSCARNSHISKILFLVYVYGIFASGNFSVYVLFFGGKQLSRNFSGAKINQPTNQPPSQAAMSFVLWYWQHLFSLRPVLSLGALRYGGFSEECADLRRRNCSHTKRRFHKYVTKENETRKLAWALPTLW